MSIKECPECFHSLGSNVEFVKSTGCCPQCGTNVKNKKGTGKNYDSIVIIILVLIVSIVGFYLWTQSAF